MLVYRRVSTRNTKTMCFFTTENTIICIEHRKQLPVSVASGNMIWQCKTTCLHMDLPMKPAFVEAFPCLSTLQGIILQAVAPTPAQAALIDQISMKDLLQFFDERIAAGREWVVWYIIYPISHRIHVCHIW